MIDITLGDAPKEKAKPFPKLMIGDDGSPLILAYAETNGEIEGTILVSATSFQTSHVGRYSSCFIACRFRDYNGQVTIQNQ